MSYKRKQDEKRRLKKLWDETKNGWLCGAWYRGDKKRIVRYWKSDYNLYRYFKKCFHKKLRHCETVNKKEYDLPCKVF